MYELIWSTECFVAGYATGNDDRRWGVVRVQMEDRIVDIPISSHGLYTRRTRLLINEEIMPLEYDYLGAFYMSICLIILFET